jgi:hypothetical protein
MVKMNWTMEHTGDRSEYVAGLIHTVTTTTQNVAQILNEEFYPLFLNKLVQLFSDRFMDNVYRCKKVNELGYQ